MNPTWILNMIIPMNVVNIQNPLNTCNVKQRFAMNAAIKEINDKYFNDLVVKESACFLFFISFLRMLKVMIVAIKVTIILGTHSMAEKVI